MTTSETELQRFGNTFAALVMLNWAFLLFGTNDAYPIFVWFEIALGITGLTVLATTWSAGINRQRLIAKVSLIGAIGGFLLWCWIQVHLVPNYGTDEIAFNEYAARLLQHGINPYKHSMQPAFDLFRVSPNGFTLRLDGTPVETFSYPSLSFLVYIPFLWLGLTSQVGILVNVLLWGLVALEMYVLAPSKMRIFVPGLISVASFTGFAVGGVTDPLYLVFLLPCLKFLTDFVLQKDWRQWISPICLGLAIAVKQTPWAAAPFIVIAVWMHARENEGEATRSTWRFVVTSVVVAAIPNIPFALWDFKAWVEGVLTPIRGGLVPAGQGLIALSTFLGIGGGNLKLVTITTFALLVLLALIQILYSDRIGRAYVIFPSIVLFFASRSFATYLIMLVPALFVSLVPTPRYRQLGPKNAATLKRVALVCIIGVVATSTLSLATEPPLKISIDSIHTTGQLATVSEIRISVENRTANWIDPQFAVQSGGSLTSPWNIQFGRRRLSPKSVSALVLTSPNFPSQPRLTGGFQVAALTTQPQALSVSVPYKPTNWHIAVSPQAVNVSQVIGVPINLKCQLLDEMNRPVRIAGVPMYLGQVTYAQSGIVFSQAVINQANVGQTPVSAMTNRHGWTTFVVRGTEATRDPVYFEANLVNRDTHFPYGYSEIVSIRFKAN